MCEDHQDRVGAEAGGGVGEGAGGTSLERREGGSEGSGGRRKTPTKEHSIRCVESERDLLGYFVVVCFFFNFSILFFIFFLMMTHLVK